MKKTKEEASETRLAILQSALDTFYEKGYTRTTFDEIAKRIGYTKGAVYWHFRNKPDLVTALINDYITRQREYVDGRIGELKTLNDILTYFLYMSEYIISSENNRKLAFFMALQMEWSEALITKVKLDVDEHRQKLLNKLKEALTFIQNSGEIDDDVDLDKTTYAIKSVWLGLLSSYLGHRCPYDLKVMVTQSFNLIFNGLKKERVQNASK